MYNVSPTLKLRNMAAIFPYLFQLHINHITKTFCAPQYVQLFGGFSKEKICRNSFLTHFKQCRRHTWPHTSKTQTYGCSWLKKTVEKWSYLRKGRGSVCQSWIRLYILSEMKSHSNDSWTLQPSFKIWIVKQAERKLKILQLITCTIKSNLLN